MIRLALFRTLAVSSCLLVAVGLASGQSQSPAKPRGRDLGVPFDGTPGPLNGITDVTGVTVGHTTLISGEGKLQIGKGPVRTGVTAVLPRGLDSMNNPVFAGWWSLNGNGEMTGTTWVEESGFLEGPVMITNTHSVGVVRDAVIQWRVNHGQPDPTGYWWSLPVVAETWDGWLNDINGFHVKPEHAFHAIDSAHTGAVEEGAVGGGTGMVCNGFKGGIGTSSRKLEAKDGGYTVGILVQCNYGSKNNLRIAGIPIGREIAADDPYAGTPFVNDDHGSIIVVIATDAPLIAHPRFSRARPQRQHLRQRLRRHLHRLLDRQSRGRCCRPCCRSENVAQRKDRTGVRRHRPGHRGSRHQRHGRRRNHDGHRKSPRPRATPRSTPRHPKKIQPVSELVEQTHGGEFLARVAPEGWDF